MKGTTISPGRRHQLAQLGIPLYYIGKVVNRTTLPVPKNSAELEEMLNDNAKAKEIISSPKALTEFITDYAREQQGDGTDLNRLVAEETQRQLANMLKENDQKADKDSIRRLNLDPQTRPAGMSNSHRQATAHNPKAAGAVLDNKFGSFEEYARATWHLNTTDDAREKKAEIRNASSSTSPAEGGFLVPEIFRSQLLQLALETAVVRPRATVVPMESARVQFPMVDATTHVGSVFGGMVAYWAEESAAFQESQPKFGRATLDAKKLTWFGLVPNELLADSFLSFSSLLETLWPQALAHFEDASFMTGNGVGQPLGFLGSGNPAAVAVTKESGQPAASIMTENVIKMYSRMLPSSLNRAVWLATPAALVELYTLAVTVGVGGAPVMLLNIAGPGPMTILGRPLIITEKASVLGTRGDLSFVDLGYYLVGDRQQMSMDQSTEYRFGNDQTAVRIIQRVDGRPWLTSAITPTNNGPSLSPFVELETRS